MNPVSGTVQTACSFASEIISFIPDPEIGKTGKTSPAHPPIPTPKPNAGQTVDLFFHVVWCVLHNCL